MATQSLYRRYRPRRFAEVKGQDHVVQALRNAVAEGREGQAYLFSGPRGTGKTTSARIMAKVLNCTNVIGGEPCCECESCLSVEKGTSYDVHELDAASNNGVDAMRDLIEKASLGTPGRHKVYILDEVHMLSKAAEAALLKTLEEPPPHVVFVLATTDPQKMSDTIRSRTQHLQFHLVGSDTMQEHVRWVAEEAGLDVTDDAIQQVLSQGAGSPRDTLSALELVANSGGRGAETVPLEVFVESMIDTDAGRALSMTASAIGIGRDPRTLAEELIGYMRNGFLSLMAPDLVLLPGAQVDALADQARRLGPAGLVRGIEVLGEALTEMRHAPDPRVLLDVAVVRLTSDAASNDVSALTARIAKLEAAIASGAVATASPAPAAAVPAAQAAAAPAASPASAPAPVDSSTGRAKLGGRARREEQPEAAPATPAPAATAETNAPAAPQPEPAASPAPVAAAGAPSGLTQSMWEDTVKPSLRGMTRAVFSPATFVRCDASSITLSLPNDTHRNKCEQNRPTVEKALSEAVGAPVSVELVAGGGGGGGGSGAGGGGQDRPPAQPSSAPQSAPAAPANDPAPQRQAPQSEQRPPSDEPPMPEYEGDAEVYVLPADDEVDVSDLVDAPPEAVKTPIDRLAEAFPGSELIDDTY